MKKVGITGGIGSGKSTVCKALHDLYGIPIYDADTEAKRLMRENAEVRSRITELFGDEAYQGEALNSSYIASKVFNDKKLLGKLNEAVHGAVRQDFEKWVERQDAPYVVGEAAVLIEAGWHNSLDVVVVVEAPLETRIERVMMRDHVTRGQVEARIANQMSDEERARYADIIVTADGIREVTEIAVALNKKLTEK